MFLFDPAAVALLLLGTAHAHEQSTAFGRCGRQRTQTRGVSVVIFYFGAHANKGLAGKGEQYHCWVPRRRLFARVSDGDGGDDDHGVRPRRLLPADGATALVMEFRLRDIPILKVGLEARIPTILVFTLWSTSE